MRRLIVPALVLLYAAQAFYFARYLVPVADGVQYLMVGAQLLSGELSSVWDDHLPGNRMPLPFYVLGLTQQWGPDLLLARFVNIAFGLLTLLLVIRLARTLGGELAGYLAGAVCATSGVIIAYWSYESYPAFAACVFTVALSLALSPSKHFGVLSLAMPALVAVFFTRTNLWPAIPFLGYLVLRRAHSWGDRAALVALFVLPLVVYFGGEPETKIFAYTPLKAWANAHGFYAEPVLALQGSNTVGENLAALMKVIRRYDALCWMALIVLPGWLVFSRATKTLVALVAWMIVATLFMCSYNFKHLGLYFASFAPAAFVMLGLGAAEGFQRGWFREKWFERITIIALATNMLMGVVVVRNPLLPLTGDPFMDAHAQAAELRASIPRDARVFLYGLPTIPYLAGISGQAHLSLAYGPDALAAMDDPRGERMGFLSRDGYAHEINVADCIVTSRLDIFCLSPNTVFAPAPAGAASGASAPEGGSHA